MDQCVICLTPVTNRAMLRCCGQPCHASCTIDCDKPSTKWPQILNCPSCQQVVPLSVLEIIPLSVYRHDPEFMEQVKAVWKENPIWYGPCYENENVTQGYWGELRDPHDANRKTIYSLGHTKNQVIPRMKTCLSFS